MIGLLIIDYCSCTYCIAFDVDVIHGTFYNSINLEY